MRRLLALLTFLTLGLQPLAAQEPRPFLVFERGPHQNQVVGIFLTPDNRQLISVSKDKTIRLWDLGSGEQLKVLRPPIGLGPEGQLRAAALSPDGKLLAVGGIGVRTEGKLRNPTYVIDL